MESSEVVDRPTTELTRAVESAGLTATSAEHLLETFSPFFNEAYPLVRGADAVTVTDATQLTEMKQAREMRLKLKAIRVECEKARKAVKDDALRTGQAIDKVAGVVKAMIEPAEAKLLEAETFAERAEAARKAALKAERSAKLAPFLQPGMGTDCYDLQGMDATAFDGLLDSLRRAHEDRIREAREAEERVKREAEVRAAEEKRVREENERLKAEREAQERAAKAEREKHEAELRREREAAEKARLAEQRAREAAEKELADQRAAEAKAEKAKADAERRAARAPDREKVLAVARDIVAHPDFADKTITEQVRVILADASKRLMALAESLK